MRAARRVKTRSTAHHTALLNTRQLSVAQPQGLGSYSLLDPELHLAGFHSLQAEVFSQRLPMAEPGEGFSGYRGASHEVVRIQPVPIVYLNVQAFAILQRHFPGGRGLGFIGLANARRA